MDVLVIGGTRFMGRRIVETALARGHSVTLFNRGKESMDLFAGQVERITGDRDGELGKLAGRTWDAVIDTPGYVPRVVRASARFFKEAVGRYLFISTISVYDPEPGATSISEDTRKATLPDPAVEVVTPETYGGLKALCEHEIDETYGARALIVRPGFIVGPHDPTDRFTYWAMRLAQGGTMLAGGRPDAPIQIIDARDIAEFCVRQVEEAASGPFNVCGPAEPLSWGAMLERGKRALSVETELVWVAADKLERAGVLPGQDLPLYQGTEPQGDAFMRTDNSRALQSGLAVRPVEATFRDTVEWATQSGAPMKVGLSVQREAEILAQVR